jgi:PAT family beta-lactamase induction signal transducer AmpG
VTEPAAHKTSGVLAGFKSWRLGAVTVLSLSSGLPLGLIVTAMPAWLQWANVDLKLNALLTLTQIPYGLKFVWSPVMDYLRPPFLGFRRGWIFVCQVVLAAGTATLGFVAAGVETCDRAFKGAACDAIAPPSPGMMAAIASLALLISFTSASQDIVYDAYTVDVLEKHEHGPAVGARSAMYRTGMWLSGSIAISLGPVWGWHWTLAAQALVYAALVPVTIFAPEPKLPHEPPKRIIDAIWQPFVGFLGRPRALEITAFVLLYRLADSFAGALVTPFLLQRGFSAFDVGVVRGAVGVWGTVLGNFLGGLLASRIGVGRALWICGALQIVSNAGYAAVALIDPKWGMIALPSFRGDAEVAASISLPLQSAIFVETGTGGMGWGAFGVLLLRLTDKRFSATQYALFSSLVGLARTFVGPPAGIMADAMGWAPFFLVSMTFGVPGMVILKRFVPWGQEPKELTGDALEPIPAGPPWAKRTLWLSGLAAGLSLALASLTLSFAMAVLKAWRTGSTLPAPPAPDLGSALHTTFTSLADLMAAAVFGLVGGIAVPAYLAARGRQSGGGGKANGPATG